MNNSENLIQRREKIVPQGIGIFNRSTAVTAKNSIITDCDGRELIDFCGGIGVMNVGHGQEKVVNAICEQAKKLTHACFHISTYEPYVELCEKLADLFPHGDSTKVMLTNTGAESVENAIKIARQATGRQSVICFTDAFHGRSMMAMTLTSKTGYKFGCGPFAPEVYRIQYPNYHRYNDGLASDVFVERELRRFEDALSKYVPHDQVAAVIIEPVQGEGGFVAAPFEYLQGLRTLCDKYGILLICDEVQSGFCRTGKWAAYQHAGITPDISTYAKSIGAGMPIGAVVGKADIMDKALPGTIGGTYLGNPVACAAAIATIEYYEENNINQKSDEIAEVCLARMQKWQNSFDIVGNISGIGAMRAFEMIDSKTKAPAADLCAALQRNCLEQGLIIISAGPDKNAIRILTPLTIGNEVLVRGLDIIEQELAKL